MALCIVNSTIVLTYKYKLLPTRGQHAALLKILEDQRELYNGCLEERIDFYRKSGGLLGYKAQSSSLTQLRAECPGWSDYPVTLQRGTLRRLDSAFTAFFRRVKSGHSPGFPRFKRKDGFTSFQFCQWHSVRLIGRRLHFKGMPGSLRVKLHRELPSSDIRGAIFKRSVRGWTVSFLVGAKAIPQRVLNSCVGLDMGLTSLATLSTGTKIANLRLEKSSHEETALLKKRLMRRKKGSKRRAKARAQYARRQKRLANTRATYLHQVSARLVRSYDLIAIEELNSKGLVTGNYARSVHDAAWYSLAFNIRYKASKAGALVMAVDPRHTSQTCPECGAVKKKTLFERIHSCPCGCLLDRDVAAARVILLRALERMGDSRAVLSPMMLSSCS